MGSWLFGFLCVCLSVWVHSEPQDFVTVFRIDDSGSMATKEFHRMTSTLGFILRTKDYALIDSMKGMHSFTFHPSDPSCYKSGTWSMESYDVSEEENFTIVTDEEMQYELSEGKCTVNNGGCPAVCAEGFCHCPSGFVFHGSSASCYGENDKYEVLGDLSGRVETDFKHFLIIAPVNYTIRAMIETNSDCGVKIIEWPTMNSLLTVYSYSRQMEYVESQTNLLLVRYIPDDPHGFGYDCKPYEVTYSVRRKLITLMSESGELTIDVHPVLPYLCLTIIFKSVSNTSELLITVKQTEFQIPRSHFRKIGLWNLYRFQTPLETSNPLTLSVIVSGTGTVIHSILECFEGGFDVTPLKNLPVSSLPNMTGNSISNKDGELCQNRGIYDPESGTCNCIPGFIGNNCEQGCGPNSYGEDCKARCSMFDKECSKMIFCKKGMPCFCAPGYEGKLCNSHCSFGSYGASCQNICDKCRYERCDIYTGECLEECLPGFYPPLCQESYKYSAEAPTVTFKSFNSVSLALNSSATKGRGIIKRYQVQCREISRHQDWLEYQLQDYISGIVTTNISGLNPGTTYEARIIYYSEDGNSFQDDDVVPKAVFSTLCKIPESGRFNLNVEDVSSTYIVISWEYNVAKDNSCLIAGYEVTLRKGWQRILRNVSSELNRAEFSGLLSGEKYTVKVQAFTSFGRAPISPPLEIETLGTAPRHVRDLKVIPLDDTRLTVSWNQPRLTGGNITEYTVDYKCNKYLSDFKNCDCNFHNQFKTSQTSVDLVGLYPFTQYIIKVAGKVESLGPYSFAYGATKEAAPNVAPEASSTPVVSRTNSSFAVEWLPPSDCKALNGFLAGYHFELQSSNGHTLFHGNTSDTSASFNNLTPQTSYLVQIFVMTSAGWNKSHALDINVTTAATVPEAVQDLIVYKRARRMLGLRWAAPKETYGEIKTFTISYRHGNSKEITERVMPKKCVPWPDYFCHTIQNLIPNKKYTITVAARNEHVHSDGRLTNITSVTVEGAPDSPESLTLVERTSTTVSLQWSPPFMFNGVLRSFVINVEQIDAANSSDCCDYYPVQEVPVKDEQQYYYFQATNLKPASKYSIGVSSKTLTMSSSPNLTVNTRPLKPELQPPVLVETGLVQLPPPFEYPGVDSTYLLLVLPGFEISIPEIRDAEEMALLQEAVNASFYIVKELQYEDMLEEPEVVLGTGQESHEGLLGLVQDPALNPGKYRVGLAVLLDYGGAKTVGFAASEPFSIEEE